MPDLGSLIDRIQDAAGEDRGINDAIRVAVGGGEDFGWNYTGSIDDALTLIPAGWVLTKLFQFKETGTGLPFHWGATLNVWDDPDPGYWWSASAETPALALCAAALMARKTLAEMSAVPGIS